MTFALPTFTAGLALSLSLIMALGPQNAHLLRMGLQRQHVWLTAGVCMVSDMLLIGIGVAGLAQVGASEPSKRIITGFVIVAAVIVDTLRQRRAKV